MDEYFKKIMLQCRVYVKKHYRPGESSEIDMEDIASEMILLIWQSYRNKNGLGQVIEKQHMPPEWQIRLLFKNALRNLGCLDKDKEEVNPNNGNGKAIYDEDGEIVDFWVPVTDEEPELPIDESEKEQWLAEIRRLQKVGYQDKEIIRMLQPVVQRVKNSNGSGMTAGSTKKPEQGGLF